VLSNRVETLRGHSSRKRSALNSNSKVQPPILITRVTNPKEVVLQHLALRQIQFPRPPTRSALSPKAFEQRSSPFAIRDDRDFRLGIVKSAHVDLPRATDVLRPHVEIIPDLRAPGVFHSQLLLMDHAVVLEAIDADLLLAEKSVGEGDVAFRTAELEEPETVRVAHAPSAGHAGAFEDERIFSAEKVPDHEALVAGCVPAQGANCVVANVEPAVNSSQC
jgi:hypothetical protein